MSKEKLIDLDREQLDLLHTILKRHIPGKTVWAYGSRVEWKAGETSDLDLAVFSCDPMEIYDLKEALEESDLLISVDVMDWESIPDDFKENIRRKYVMLQDKAGKPDGWREVKLGDVVRFQRGHDLPKSKMKKGDVPVAGSNGIIGYHNTATTHAPGITVGRSGNIGAAKLYKTDFWAHNTTLYVKDFFGNDEVFIFYLLQTLDLSGFNSGSAVPTLNRNYIHELDISVPQLHEQKAIAEVLSTLDDKIDLLHRQNKTLEDMAQALFRKWFTSPESKQWDTGTLPHEFAVIMGQSPPGTSYNEEKLGTPLFQGNADFGFRFPRNRVYTTQPKRLTEKFDTLISVRAPVGEQNMAQENCCIGRGVASFRYKKNGDYYSYTYYKMKSLMNEIKQFNAEGTVFGSISKGDFEKLETVLPPDNLIREFQKKVQEIDEKIYFNHTQIHQLENLREILLPKLMSGEVKLLPAENR